MATGEQPQGPDKVAAGCGVGCVGLVVIVAVVLLLTSLFGGDDEDEAGGGEYGARDVCEQFVEDRLKAPATAEFSETNATGGGSSWTVTGAVDSENGFGAMLRSTYVCKVQHDTGDEWTLIDLEVD